MNGPTPPFEEVYPGLYRDANGNAVFNVADILEYWGQDDTPENRQELMELLLTIEHDGPTLYRPPGAGLWQHLPEGGI